MRIGLVGLGTVARSHVEACQRVPGLQVVAGMDVAGDAQIVVDGRRLPLYRSIQELVGENRLDAVIVATPTPTHAEVCRQLLDLDALPRILVEKPLAVEMDDVRGLLELASARGRSLDVLYHFRYAPEVIWAVDMLDALVADHGPITVLESFFADPYVRMNPHRRETYVSSWIDSGINALSLMDRFVDLVDVTEFRVIPHMISSFEAAISYRSLEASGTASLLTTWNVTEESRWTRIGFADDAELILEHAAVLGRVVLRGRTLEVHGSDGSVPRRTAHYVNALSDVFSPAYEPNPLLHLMLHRMLLDCGYPR